MVDNKNETDFDNLCVEFLSQPTAKVAKISDTKVYKPNEKSEKFVIKATWSFPIIKVLGRTKARSASVSERSPPNSRWFVL